MIPICYANGADEEKLLTAIENRAKEMDDKVTLAVTGIIAAVKKEGDRAVFAFSKQFDGGCPDVLEVPGYAIEKALSRCDAQFYNAMCRAAENIRAFHARQKQQSFIDVKPNGVLLGQRVAGLSSVGLYVPGGTAAYPSSVLMNAIPAKIAGVKQLVMVTPPGKDGNPNDDILAAAAIAGIDRVFQIGGAQAIAALAFGTESVPKVDKIVGPGNIYVATAKKLLFGTVDIDMIAGPSEILILADESASPCYLAADLLSQAEHDTLASAMLLTTSERVARETAKEIMRQAKNLSRRNIIEKALSAYGGIIVCDHVERMIALANRIAPEHLEVMLAEPLSYLGLLDHAGSIFLGPYSPEPVGDYFAGPNHVLPTGGTARFFSPLGVECFVKRSSFICYTKDALLDAADDIMCFARREGLDAHAGSIGVRVGREGK